MTVVAKGAVIDSYCHIQITDMKSTCFVALALVLLGLTHTTYAQTGPPRLIVRGDDMGYSHAGNEAIVKCYKEGIETAIEVLVPSPWFPEAVKLLEQMPNVDVGVHLTLTSEWDNLK